MKKQIFAIIIAMTALTAVSSAQSSFTIWKTVRTSGTLTIKTFLDSAEKKGIQLSPYDGTIDVVNELTLDTTTETIHLVIVTGEDLGLINSKQCFQMDSVIQKAKRLGLKPCPAMAVLQVCLEKKVIPYEIVSDLKTKYYNSIRMGIGTCGETKGKFIVSASGIYGSCYHPGDKFIFMLAKE